MGSITLFVTFVRIIGNVNGVGNFFRRYESEMNSADYRSCIIRKTIVNTILCVIDGWHPLLSFVYSIDDYLTSYQHSNFNFTGRHMSAGVECMMDLWNCLIWKLISFQLILILSGGNTTSVQAVTLSLTEELSSERQQTAAVPTLAWRTCGSLNSSALTGSSVRWGEGKREND
jgi:hypothetical protein